MHQSFAIHPPRGPLNKKKFSPVYAVAVKSVGCAGLMPWTPRGVLPYLPAKGTKAFSSYHATRLYKWSSLVGGGATIKAFLGCRCAQ